MEDATYCWNVELGEQTVIGGFGSVKQMGEWLRTESIRGQRYELPASHTTETERQAAERGRVDRCGIGTLRRLRDALLLVSAVKEIARHAEQVIPGDSFIPSLQETLASKRMTIMNVHDSLPAGEAVLPSIRWRSMASAIVLASDPRTGYRLDRTLDLIRPWLEDVQQLADRAAAALPATASEVTARAQELALANARLQHSSPHEAQAHSRFGDVDCAFELLSLLQNTDHQVTIESFEGVVRDLSGHLAAQMGSHLGTVQVMRGLSTIIAVLSSMQKGYLEEPGFLDRARKLILVYRIPSGLFGDVVGGLIQESKGYDPSGIPQLLPVSPTGVYAWARAAQYLSDEIDLSHPGPSTALATVREQFTAFTAQYGLGAPERLLRSPSTSSR
ncbi:hypothetical protein GCM10010211_81040 [Streptomyces albospinus]|uniref:Uncharacterized protein n=1 Tax=Streptomyces albospinus TaxID=285515 RepID=A0ABQ2VNV9_9ACTN|nr:hypothetical protein [Streptomyces albospinus]GGV01528.1 hypothetical protein GCM10010211_81040 [Streptomyces albospinus]